MEIPTIVGLAQYDPSKNGPDGGDYRSPEVSCHYSSPSTEIDWK